MTIQAVADLKAKFEAGDIPNGQDFIDLIDTLLDIDSQWPAVLSAADGSNLTNLSLPNPLPALSAEQLYNLTPNEWYDLASLGPTYADATSFVLTGDRTALFPLDKRIRLTVNGAYEYTTPLTATYDATPDATTVTLADAMTDVTLTLVEVSVFSPFNSGGAVSPEMVGVNVTGIPVVGTDTYTATPGHIEYVTGKSYPLSFANTNTDPAPTIQFDALAVLTIKNLDGSALAAGAIAAESVGRYNGVDMILLNPVTESVSLSITATINLSALTLGVKAATLSFKEPTLTNGIRALRTFGDLSLVIPSGATLGTIAAVESRLISVIIDNAGTPELAVVNQSGGNDLSEEGVITTVAIDATADSANVFYSAVSRTNVAYRIAGSVDSTQAVIGEWDTAPTLIQGIGGNTLTAMSSLGYGQTYQDVFASRALSTLYYNKTGKPIVVSAWDTTPLINAIIYGNVNGIRVAVSALPTAANNWVSIYFIVPPNSSYELTGATVDNWMELR